MRLPLQIFEFGFPILDFRNSVGIGLFGAKASQTLKSAIGNVLQNLGHRILEHLTIEMSCNVAAFVVAALRAASVSKKRRYSITASFCEML